MTSFFIKYHKWLAVIITLFIVLFSLSGILLNHRGMISSIDVDRDYLPSDYKVRNWNNAAVKSTLKITEDTIFIYGNIGMWLTDSNFKSFRDFNVGLPKGIDNRKVEKMFYSSEGGLFAGTLLGLYQYDFSEKQWGKVHLPTHEQRIVDMVEKNGKLYLLSRSHLVVAPLDVSSFEVETLPEPVDYDNKIGLFKTLWVIHSGEIYGRVGKLLVDVVGLIFIFLSITGLIIFINKYRIRSRSKKNKRSGLVELMSINIWNLRWHNKIGWITLLLLIITTCTGMFLRPPLLAAIGNARVGKIPGTELADTNPWFDKLRRIIYDEELDRFVLATLEGVYYSDDNFKSKLRKYSSQPPMSVMGVNVFRKICSGTYFVGSFEGLFVWKPSKAVVWDYIKKQIYIKPQKMGPPIGDFMVTAYIEDYKGQEIIFDYGMGAINLNRGRVFSIQPENVTQAYPLSLWNLALEVHTARMYKVIFGKYYILFIPLSGLIILFILISGFVVWWRLYKK